MRRPPYSRLSQAILLESFKPEDRGKAMGFWGLGIVVAPVLGPVLGGWLTDSYSWRWIFYINIPIGILSVIMAKLYIFDPPYMKRRAGGIDAWGIGMLALGIGALQVLLRQRPAGRLVRVAFHRLARGDQCAESQRIRLSLAEHSEPYCDPASVQGPHLRHRCLLNDHPGFVLYGQPRVAARLAANSARLSGSARSITMSPRGLGSMLGMPFVGMFIGRFDARKFLAAGLFIAALTLFRFSQLSADVGYWDLFCRSSFRAFRCRCCSSR